LHPDKVAKPGFFYGYIVVFSSFIAMLLTFGAVYSFGVFLKPMLVDLGWTVAMISGAYSLSIFMRGVLGIVTGRLTDKFGPRIVVTICGLFLGLGYLLMSQIKASWEMYLFYGVIIAIGQSGTYVPTMTTVARWFVKRRGIMTGIVVAGSGIGIVIMSPLAVWLISSYGWRTSYIIIGIVTLVLMTLAAQFLKRDPGQIKLLPYGANEVSEEQSLSQEEKGFSLREAIHTRQLWMASFVFFSFLFCLQTTLVHIVNHAIEMGISAVSAANVLATLAGLSVIGKIATGSIADRIGNKLTIALGLSLLSAALLWLIPAKELWMLYLFAVAFGFGWGTGTLISPMLAELFGQASLGTILGIIDFTSNLGGTAGPVLGGKIFDMVGSYQPAFLTCFVLSIISIIVILLIRPPRRQISSPELG